MLHVYYTFMSALALDTLVDSTSFTALHCQMWTPTALIGWRY